MNNSTFLNTTYLKEKTCLGCENLMKTYKASIGLNEKNKTLSIDSCICTEDIYSKTDVSQAVPELRWMLLIYALCIAFGSIGNIVTLITMATADRKTKSVTNIFLISLAIADLLLLFVAAPMDMVHYFARDFDIDGGACKVAEYSRVLSAVASIMNLLAVTIERFIVIVMPMRARSICTMSNSRKSLVIVWGLSLILAAPVILTKSVYPLHFGDEEGKYVTQYYCNDYDDRLSLIYVIYQLVVCFALPALLMIVCYSVVIKELWKSNKNMSLLAHTTSANASKKKSKLPSILSRRTTVANGRSSAHTGKTPIECSKSLMISASSPVHLRGNSNGDNSNIDKLHLAEPDPQAHRSTGKRKSDLDLTQNQQSNDNSQKADDVRQGRTQVIKMLICVIVLFLLCWGPRFIIEILMKIGAFKYTPLVYWTKVTLFMLPFMHAIFNPVVYFIMSRSFRQSATNKFRQCTSHTEKRLCCKNNSEKGTNQDDLKLETIPLTT